MSDGQSLIYSQTLTLMHELAHMYLYWTLGSKMDVYHVEQCLGLPAGKTVANVENHVYYVASEFSFPSSWVVDVSVRDKS